MIGQVVNYLSIIDTQWEICCQRLSNKVNWCYPKVSLSLIAVRIQSRHTTWPVLIGVRHGACGMSWDLVVYISSDSSGRTERTQCAWGMCKVMELYYEVEVDTVWGKRSVIESWLVTRVLPAPRHFVCSWSLSITIDHVHARGNDVYCTVFGYFPRHCLQFEPAVHCGVRLPNEGLFIFNMLFGRSNKSQGSPPCSTIPDRRSS